MSTESAQLSIEIEPGVRVSGYCKNGQLIDHYFDDVRTVYDGWLRGLKYDDGNRDCLGVREGENGPFKYLSYNEVHRRAHALGSAFISKLHLAAGQSTFVGIYSKNSIEWTVTDLACQKFSMPTVPLYDTLGKEAQLFIIRQANIQAVVVDDAKRAENLAAEAEKLPSLKHLVLVFDDIPQSLHDTASKGNITLSKFNDLIKEGESNLQKVIAPKADDIFTVCYTSGTTGMPKGVILAHKNMIAAAAGVFHADEQFKVVATGSDNVVISYLPLAHVFERLLETAMVSMGSKIGYFSGDFRRILEDLRDIAPTVFPCVPRVANRIVDKIKTGVESASFLKRLLFRRAFDSKLAEVKKGNVSRDTWWDTLVFRHLQKLLGGRVNIIVCGSAPIHPNVLEFMRVVFGCRVVEGYGQTETSSADAISYPGDTTIGQVGPPLPCNYIKLDDVPELNYFAKDNKGEICIKGSNCTSGYLNDPEKTAELIDKDGWLRTGDIGEWLPNGTLRLIDRKKHIFKLAQGEYVAPEKIELLYARCPLVAQVFVDGDSLQTCTVAVIVPSEPDVRTLLAEKAATFESLKDRKIDPAEISFDEICKIPEVKQIILSELAKLAKSGNLNSIEHIKDCYLSSELFSIENELLTQTMKTKRPQVRSRYKVEIENMYAEINAKLAAAAASKPSNANQL